MEANIKFNQENTKVIHLSIYFHSPLLWRQKATALSRLCLRRCAGLQRSHWRGNPPIYALILLHNMTTNLQLVRIIGVNQSTSPQCNFPFSQKLKSRKFCNDANPPTRVLKQTARTQQLIGEESDHDWNYMKIGSCMEWEKKSYRKSIDFSSIVG